jgi:hypothetical protein
MQMLLGLSDVWMVALFLLFLIVFVYFVLRTNIDVRPMLRPIAAYAALKDLLARAAEAGQTVHISIGTGGIGQASPRTQPREYTHWNTWPTVRQ